MNDNTSHLNGEEALPDENGYLTDEIDHDILMHREAHFSGDFAVMLTYYQNEGMGTLLDIDLERIEYLAEVEKELGKNLAPYILTGVEAERVARAKQAYAALKEIYELEEEKSPLPRLIADLIFIEEEEKGAKSVTDEVIGYSERIVPELLALIKDDRFYDPLFPGYGLAPAAAIFCLGEIKDERAIVPLFELLGKEFLFDEEVIFNALYSIGSRAKTFLLKILCSQPITNDNENAAFALAPFLEDDSEVKESFKKLINDKTIPQSFCKTLRSLYDE